MVLQYKVLLARAGDPSGLVYTYPPAESGSFMSCNQEALISGGLVDPARQQRSVRRQIESGTDKYVDYRIMGKLIAIS